MAYRPGGSGPTRYEPSGCAVVFAAAPRTAPVSDTVCRVKALVVMASGHAFDQVALKAHCKAQLAAHKVPRIFEERGGLPVSQTGKVLRGSL